MPKFNLREMKVVLFRSSAKARWHVVMRAAVTIRGAAIQTMTLCGRREVHGHGDFQQPFSAHEFAIVDPVEGYCSACQQRLEAIEAAFRHGEEGYR